MVLKSSPDTSNTATKYSPALTLDWASSVLIRTEVGSTAHGLSLEGKDDYDEIVAMSRDLEYMLKEAADNIDIPAEPNYNIINEWLLKVFDWKRNENSVH